MVACRVTFEFYNICKNGMIAKKETEKTVEVFGARRKDIMTKDGKSVQERFELLLLVEMGLSPADIEEFDYHVVECTEHEIPDDFFDDFSNEDDEGEEETEDEEDEDEVFDFGIEAERFTNGDTVIEIDRETGTFKFVSDDNARR